MPDSGTNRPIDCAAVIAPLANGQVLADEKPVQVFPDETILQNVLLPLLAWCRERRPVTGRNIVGIVAPAGAGKSLLTAWLAATARALGWREFEFFSQDGYHFPNVVLAERTGRDAAGNAVPLRQLKGTPATFDAAQLLADLQTLKANRQEILLPAYSRVQHDPVAGRVRVGTAVEWVFVEGNFLFLDVAPWCEIRQLLDRKIYLDASDTILWERLGRRHQAAGRTPAWIAEHFQRTDGPNIQQIRTTAKFADVIFEWDAAGRLSPR